MSNKPQRRAQSGSSGAARTGGGGNDAQKQIARLTGKVNALTRLVQQGAQPLAPQLTGAPQQAAYAQQLVAASQMQNSQSFAQNRPGNPGSATGQQAAAAQQRYLAGAGAGAGAQMAGRRPAAGQPAIPGVPGAGGATGAPFTNAALLDGANGLPNTPSGVSPLQSAMETNQAPQADPATMFAPGAPLRTVPGLESAAGPRQFNYPVAYNVGSLPRSTEITSTAKLRNLAVAYEGIQLAEAVWFDVINRLEPHITFEENTIPDGESEDDPKWRAIADDAQQFVEHPDGQLSLAEWMTASVRDVLELGFSAIFLQKDRMGRVISLDLIDTATVKPLVDERGRQPTVPWAAYQQYLYGVPSGAYRADEIITVRETARTDSVYPFSRIDRIILRVNMALRKENLDTRRFTDGSMPAGMLVPDVNLGWTPEDVEDYEARFNDLLGGNDRQRVRIKVTPPGSTFIPSNPDDPSMDFDRYLLNITAAAFGLTMDELGMTETSNRSVGDSQENVVYRRLVMPLGMRYAALFTRIIKARYDKRLKLGWRGFEEREDQLQKAQTLDIAVKGGWISPSRAARDMGYPVDLEVPPMVLTKDGPVWLEDALALREAQLDAKLAGFEFAMGAPGSAQGVPLGDQPDGQPDATPAPPIGGDEEEGEEGDQPSASGAAGAAPAKPGAPKPPAGKTAPAAPAKPGAATPATKTAANTKSSAATADKATVTGGGKAAPSPAKVTGAVGVRQAFERARQREQRATAAPETPHPAGPVIRRLSPTESAHATHHVIGATRHAEHDLAIHQRQVFDEVARRAHAHLSHV